MVFLKFPDGYICSNNEFQGPVENDTQIKTLLTFKTFDTYLGELDDTFPETLFSAQWHLSVDDKTAPFRSKKRAKVEPSFEFDEMKKRMANADTAKTVIYSDDSDDSSAGGSEDSKDDSSTEDEMSIDECE